MSVILLSCTHWLYLGNCFVCCKGVKKLYNPCSWFFQETFKVDVKLLLKWVLLSRGVTAVFSLSMAVCSQWEVGTWCLNLALISDSNKVNGISRSKLWTSNVLGICSSFLLCFPVPIMSVFKGKKFLVASFKSLPFTDVHGIWTALLNIIGRLVTVITEEQGHQMGQVYVKARYSSEKVICS